MIRLALVLVLACVATPSRAQELPAARRVAIVVGTNSAPPGRRRLRYAEADARAAASVLRTVGGFTASDIDVLVDPTPQSVLDAIDRRTRELAAAGGESVLLFHYAGHADAQSLYPRGQPLAYDALRRRLGAPGPTVRIGIVDACRGGGWTGTRSLVETAPFDVDVPLDLASEGTVLIASSSGVEDARESEDLGAGFFTHHWNAALRGAGDRNGDGVVSLGEAFDYAKRLTIRDSAATGHDAQHPSFQMNVRGRADIPLARVAASDSIVTLTQLTGPTEVVQLDTGLLVLEVPSGERTIRIALPVGHYLFRIRSNHATRAIDVALRPRGNVTVLESDMTSRSDARSVARTADTNPVDAPAPPPGYWDVRLAMGVSYWPPYSYSPVTDDPDVAPGTVERDFAALGWIGRGFGRRAFWSFPLVFGLDLRTARGTSFVPWVGLRNIGGGLLGDDGWISAQPAIGVRTETPFGRDGTFVFDLHLDDRMFIWTNSTGSNRHALIFGAEAGVRASVDGRVDVGLGVSVTESVGFRGGLTSLYRPALGFGALYRQGRGLPLVRVHLSRVFALDAYGMIDYSFETKHWGQTFLLGATAVWPGHALRRASRAGPANADTSSH